MRRVLSIVVAVIVAGLIASRGIFNSIDSKIEAAAVELNKDVPKMVDSVTRLDHVSSKPPKGIVFEYTLVNLPTTTFTPEQKTILQDTVRNQALSKPEFRQLIEQGVTAYYVYRNEARATMLEFTISPSDLK